MAPGLKQKKASNSLTTTAAPVTADANLTPQNVASTSTSTQISGADCIMAPGLKPRRASYSLTATAAPVTADATLTPQNVASTSPSTETSGAGACKRERVRGPTRGKRVRQLLAQHDGKRLEVYVTPEMRAFCGKHATKVAAEFGVQVQSSCPIEGFYKSWRRVNSGLKGAIVQAVRDKFRITEDDDEFTELVDEVINEKANKVYIEWKHEIGRHYRLAKANYKETKDARDHPIHHPYKGVDLDGWKYMVEHVFKDKT